MMCRIPKSNLFFVVLVVFLCGLVVDPAAGEMPGQMPPDGMPGMGPGMGPGMMPGMGMGRQGYGANSAVSKALAELIGMINVGQVPDKPKLLELRDVARKNMPKKRTPNKDVCLYYMLQAWTTYYGGDELKAMKLSSGAVKKDGTNKDALKTDVAIKVLTGNANRIKPAVTAKSANARAGYNEFGGYGGGASKGDLLDLDVESIRKDMIGGKVTGIQASCVNGTMFAYNPGEGPLCVVFWQVEDTVDPASMDMSMTEPNGAPIIRKKPSNPQYGMNQGMSGMMPGMMMPGMMPGMGGGYGGNRQKMDPMSLQMRAFGNIFAERVGKGVKFLAINTDSFFNKDTVLDKLLGNGWPWAQVMVEGSGFSMGLDQFADVKVEVDKPFILITDENGVIRYAGNASGFLTPMVLEKYAGKTGEITIEMGELGGEEMNKAMEAMAEAMAKAFEGMGEGMGEMVVQQGGQTQVVRAKPVKAPAKEVLVEDSTDITVDEFQAQKLYEHAKAQVKIGIKMGSPRKGVGLCREIIRKYPGTASADKTRALLRGLPDRYKKKYRLTKEEMGL